MRASFCWRMRMWWLELQQPAWKPWRWGPYLAIRMEPGSLRTLKNHHTSTGLSLLTSVCEGKKKTETFYNSSCWSHNFGRFCYCQPIVTMPLPQLSDVASEDSISSSRWWWAKFSLIKMLYSDRLDNFQYHLTFPLIAFLHRSVNYQRSNLKVGYKQ